MRRYGEIEGTHRERPGIGRRARFLAVLLAVFLAGSTIAAGTTMLVTGLGATAAGPTTLSGATSADAAASCWEIKQRYPGSADGVYWLRNDVMVRPDRFYCDMTTDGGGWVLIGRGPRRMDVPRLRTIHVSPSARRRHRTGSVRAGGPVVGHDRRAARWRCRQGSPRRCTAAPGR